MSATALISALSGTNSLKAASLFDVRGWVAVVTGGGTGLGLVTALALAENGAKVYITGRRPEPLEEAAKAFAARAEKANGTGEGGAIVAVQADVSTKEGIKSAWDRGELAANGTQSSSPPSERTKSSSTSS